MAGKIERLWIKRVEGSSPDEVSAVTALADAGIAGNYRLGGRRQVTVLSTEAWDAAQEQLSMTLDPILRRANVLVSGIDLEASNGRVLHLGSSSILIRGETKPCNIMEAACPGLRDALRPNWRGGVYGEVVAGGEIRVGDEVSWHEEDEA